MNVLHCWRYSINFPTWSSSNRPFCDNRLSHCHTFIVRGIILLSFKYQTNNRYISRTQPMRVETQNFRTTNNSHYSSVLSLVTVTDIVKYKNKMWQERLCDDKVTLRRIRLIVVAVELLYEQNLRNVHVYSCDRCLTAQRIRRILLPSVAFWLYQFFPHYCIYGTIFGAEISWKRVFWFPLQFGLKLLSL